MRPLLQVSPSLGKKKQSRLNSRGVDYSGFYSDPLPLQQILKYSDVSYKRAAFYCISSYFKYYGTVGSLYRGAKKVDKSC